MSAFPRFEEFFSAVHGYSPYQWQIRLADEVAGGAWPQAIAAPTGAGKTAVIDIAVWRLAAEAAQLAPDFAPRTAPMRIIFAVNRRVVVDQAFERATKIAKRLEERDNPAVCAVSDALVRLSCDKPLHVEQLRGGLPREDDWARTPVQPTVLCTTIDQLGSRLLFRGYGVSDRMAPIHAGLLGEDALILLDEAHLSDAFSQTLRCIERWRREREFDLGLPWRVCRLTATPRPDDKPFVLGDSERAEEGVAKRLRALKQARLELCKTEGDAIAKAFASEARGLIAKLSSPHPVVAVIVNRVSLARAIFDELHRSRNEGIAEDYVLLTGRSRPAERDALIKQYERDLGGDRTGPGPLFVVATQCIEAGADFDFDAMVTEIAPLDALIQRFGRLHRAGNRNEGEAALAVILALKDDVAARTDDPVYGDRMKKTWDFTAAHAEQIGEGKNKANVVDMGPTAIERLLAKDGAAGCMTEPKPAPFLREADFDFFSMTSPRPDPEPELALFLHGEIAREADVNIVWRADLTENDLETRAGEAVERAPEIVAAMPPLPGEAIAIPIWAAKAWLRDQSTHAGNISDVVGRSQDENRASSNRFVVSRAGEFVVNDATGLRPGDTIIVPAKRGGCDRFGWAPNSKEPVLDIADLAAKPYFARRIRARLHPELWKNIGSGVENWPRWSTIAEDLPGEDAVSGRAVAKKLGGANPFEFTGAPPLIDAIRAVAERSPQRPQFPYAPPAEESVPAGCVLFAGVESVATGDGESSSLTAPETLASHRVSVAKQAAAFGRLLSDALRATLEHGGLLHDDGKVDERFQTFLRAFAGDALPGEILAKSGASGGKHRGAWERAGLSSRGWRHEVLSVQMAIARANAFPKDIDAELAVWLIGTHHGQGRPFFAHFDRWDGQARFFDNGEFKVDLNGEPGPHRLSFDWDGLDWVTLFVRLKQRYGIWGIAYLEGVLRLADHRASEAAARKAQS